jgi:amidohydrolase
MKKISNAICESSGGKCEFDIKIGYPFLVNDIEVTKNARSAAVDYLGENNVVDLDLRMTSEDFAYFSQKAPSCFYRLGTSNKNNKWNLHTPSFNIDEKALSISSGLMAYIAVKQLLK